MSNRIDAITTRRTIDAHLRRWSTNYWGSVYERNQDPNKSQAYQKEMALRNRLRAIKQAQHWRVADVARILKIPIGKAERMCAPRAVCIVTQAEVDALQAAADAENAVQH